MPPPFTDFGFTNIPTDKKTNQVQKIFSTVAPYYDCMNTLLSLGLHHGWKTFATGVLDAKAGMRVLDIAGGSGDLSARLQKQVGKNGQVILTDINSDMLQEGKRRLPLVSTIQCNAELLPFGNRSFDRVIIAFGLRNITHRHLALSEIHRVLKTGGKYAILEFTSTHAFSKCYHWYLTTYLPLAGQLFAHDADSYRYLGESILRFPQPSVLCDWLRQANLPFARYLTFAGGGVCLHFGRRFD